MGREKKHLKIKYMNGNFPEHFGELLDNADDREMMTLVALLMSADKDGILPVDLKLSEVLSLDESEITSAVNFWRGAGILEYSKKEAESTENISDKKTTYAHAHKSGAVEKTVGVVEYLTGELADILENRSEMAVFVDEAQRIVGKTLNMNEIGIIVGLVEQYGFETEAILAILAYATRLGKKGMRYPEKVAIGFYDEGLTSGEAVCDRIQRIEAATQTIIKIKELFGAGNRELSTTEKNLFKKWTEQFGYDIDVIRHAYDITIDVKHEPLPKYTNGILEKWHTEKLHTIEDVERYEETVKASKTKPGDNKSYDINEFFDAALKRSFDQMN
jgi:DnaD/phage-associated family protein